MQTLEGHSGTVWSVAVSADGRHVVSGSYDKTIKVWGTQTGMCLRTLHVGYVREALHACAYQPRVDRRAYQQG